MARSPFAPALMSWDLGLPRPIAPPDDDVQSEGCGWRVARDRRLMAGIARLLTRNGRQLPLRKGNTIPPIADAQF